MRLVRRAVFIISIWEIRLPIRPETNLINTGSSPAQGGRGEEPEEAFLAVAAVSRPEQRAEHSPLPAPCLGGENACIFPHASSTLHMFQLPFKSGTKGHQIIEGKTGLARLTGSSSLLPSIFFGVKQRPGLHCFCVTASLLSSHMC